MSKFPQRGEIYWVQLDPTIGSEMKKTRPGIILSNDMANKHQERVIIAPITSSVEKIYPFEAKIKMPNGLKKACLDQLRCIDKRRLGKKIMSVTSNELMEIVKALKITLSLN